MHVPPDFNMEPPKSGFGRWIPLGYGHVCVFICKKNNIYIYHSINIITCVFHVKITVYRSTYQVLPGFSSSQISRHMSPQWSRTRCQATHASKSVRKCPGMPWGEAEGPTKPCKPCTLWLFNSLPWKIHPFLNHLFLWAMA